MVWHARTSGSWSDLVAAARIKTKPLVGGVQPVFPAHSSSELLTVAKPRCHARRGLGGGGSGDGTGHSSLGFGLDGKKKKINVWI